MSTWKIEVNEKCLKIYNEMKNKHEYGYSIFKFSDDLKYLLVDKVASPEKTSDDFLNDLPPNDIRIALLDSGSPSHKIFFVYWMPDTVPIKVKFFLASVIHDIRCTFPFAINNVGLQKELEDYMK